MELNSIRQITNSQVSEGEAMVYLLIESGLSLRDLADRLGVSHTQVSNVYHNARNKISVLANCGLLQTNLE